MEHFKITEMIKTVAEYKEFLDSLRSDLTAVWEDIPQRERNERALKIAADMNLSQTTILNYLKGLISDPETGLAILEKHSELFPKP